MTFPSRLRKRRKRLWARLQRHQDLLRGTVVRLKRRCTSPTCQACQKGQGHPTWYLSRKVQGKTRLTYLAKAKLPAARQGVQHYARVRALLEQLAELNAEALKGQPGTQRQTRCSPARRSPSRERSR